jgi:hypothetical protein
MLTSNCQVKRAVVDETKINMGNRIAKTYLLILRIMIIQSIPNAEANQCDPTRIKSLNPSTG